MEQKTVFRHYVRNATGVSGRSDAVVRSQWAACQQGFGKVKNGFYGRSRSKFVLCRT